MPLPADQIPVGRGRDPLNPYGDHIFFYVSAASLDKFGRTQPPSKSHDANLLEIAIQSPELIYRGLKRLGLEDGYCYSSRPPQRFDDAGALIPRIIGRSLLIYLEMRNYGPVIFDWDWRPANEITGAPFEAPDAFGELIWPAH